MSEKDSKALLIPISGWVLLDKPKGLTSTRVGSFLKRRLRDLGYEVKHLGHVGTLDPLATGVLLLALGEATKLIPYLERNAQIFGSVLEPQNRPQKEYTFDLRFGRATTTYDAEGKITMESSERPTRSALCEACHHFLGAQHQRPPIYSALKRQGRKLYELARRGEVVDVPEREVFIHALEIMSFDGETARFRAVVSQGTYIRSLGNDLANAVGTLGYIASLRRLRDGPFSLKQALTWEQVTAFLDRGQLGGVIMTVGSVLGDIPAVSVSEDEESSFCAGQGFPVVGAADQPAVRVMLGERLVGMGRVSGGLCFPRRLLRL